MQVLADTDFYQVLDRFRSVKLVFWSPKWCASSNSRCTTSPGVSFMTMMGHSGNTQPPISCCVPPPCYLERTPAVVLMEFLAWKILCTSRVWKGGGGCWATLNLCFISGKGESQSYWTSPARDEWWKWRAGKRLSGPSTPALCRRPAPPSCSSNTINTQNDSKTGKAYYSVKHFIKLSFIWV